MDAASDLTRWTWPRPARARPSPSLPCRCVYPDVFGQARPGLCRQADALRAAGVDEIWCVSVNDAFVMGPGRVIKDGRQRCACWPTASAAFTQATGLDAGPHRQGDGSAQQPLTLLAQARLNPPDAQVLQLRLQVSALWWVVVVGWGISSNQLLVTQRGPIPCRPVCPARCSRSPPSALHPNGFCQHSPQA